eukprot:Gb_13192 [translate_table: standard]
MPKGAKKRRANRKKEEGLRVQTSGSGKNDLHPSEGHEEGAFSPRTPVQAGEGDEKDRNSDTESGSPSSQEDKVECKIAFIEQSGSHEIPSSATEDSASSEKLGRAFENNESNTLEFSKGFCMSSAQTLISQKSPENLEPDIPDTQERLQVPEEPNGHGSDTIWDESEWDVVETSTQYKAGIMEDVKNTDTFNNLLERVHSDRVSTVNLASYESPVSQTDDIISSEMLGRALEKNKSNTHDVSKGFLTSLSQTSMDSDNVEMLQSAEPDRHEGLQTLQELDGHDKDTKLDNSERDVVETINQSKVENVEDVKNRGNFINISEFAYPKNGSLDNMDIHESCKGFGMNSSQASTEQGSQDEPESTIPEVGEGLHLPQEQNGHQKDTISDSSEQDVLEATGQSKAEEVEDMKSCDSFTTALEHMKSSDSFTSALEHMKSSDSFTTALEGVHSNNPFVENMASHDFFPSDAHDTTSSERPGRVDDIQLSEKPGRVFKKNESNFNEFAESISMSSPKALINWDNLETLDSALQDGHKGLQLTQDENGHEKGANFDNSEHDVIEASCRSEDVKDTFLDNSQPNVVKTNSLSKDEIMEDINCRDTSTNAIEENPSLELLVLPSTSIEPTVDKAEPVLSIDLEPLDASPVDFQDTETGHDENDEEEEGRESSLIAAEHLQQTDTLMVTEEEKEVHVKSTLPEDPLLFQDSQTNDKEKDEEEKGKQSSEIAAECSQQTYTGTALEEEKEVHVKSTLPEDRSVVFQDTQCSHKVKQEEEKGRESSAIAAECLQQTDTVAVMEEEEEVLVKSTLPDDPNAGDKESGIPLQRNEPPTPWWSFCGLLDLLSCCRN